MPLQQVCPSHTADHFAIGSYDAVGWALALDALTHVEPAVPVRVSPAVCLQPLMPGVDPRTFARDDATFLQYATDGGGDAADVPAEPALRSFVVTRG